jgi:NAD(P) transhydrogenase subunit alpha
MNSLRVFRKRRLQGFPVHRQILFVLLILLGGMCLDLPHAAGQEADMAVQTTTSETSVGAEGGFSRQDALIASVTIFVLAVFVGFEVITKVPPTLHTPLMSGSNAISGITLVGALVAAGTGVTGSLASWLGAAAVAMASVNVVGGFLVTHRMLAMFRRK